MTSPADAAEDPAQPSASLTRSGVRLGLRRMAPVAVVVVPFGMGFGAAAIEAGLAPLEALAMSAVVFAGASQFAVLEVWHAPLPLLTIAALTLAVNARHVVMGAALSGWLRGLPWARRTGSLMLLSDANFADAQAAAGQGVRDVGVLVGGGLALWMGWVLGTAGGVALGAALGSLDRLGVDVVMPAFFAAALLGAVRSRADLPPIAVAGLAAVAASGALPAGWDVIGAALCGGLVGALRR